ncbi:MAG TPA: hypothetical protein VMP01_02275 [Pirellulaceae bacterium]|nr:hypothetical protein [Pirellulaceae bacterium]
MWRRKLTALNVRFVRLSAHHAINGPGNASDRDTRDCYVASPFIDDLRAVLESRSAVGAKAKQDRIGVRHPYRLRPNVNAFHKTQDDPMNDREARGSSSTAAIIAVVVVILLAVPCPLAVILFGAGIFVYRTAPVRFPGCLSSSSRGWSEERVVEVEEGVSHLPTDKLYGGEMAD